MKNATLQFDFLVDKDKHTITVKREFGAGRQLVWDCHTKKEYLNQWFAPKPMTTETKSMDFRAGGHWHYAMVMPDGQKYWGLTKYTKINPIDGYDTIDAFTDETGVINENLPAATWAVTFKDEGADKTTVQTIVKYPTLEGLEQVLNMGMKEGLESTLTRLDELLEKIKK